MEEIKIWTDGSAIVTGDKLGGSGVYMKHGDGREVCLSKGWRNTKTGRAEIHAVLIALRHLENVPSKVTFYMDSEYVQRSILEYMPSWIRNNWMGTAGPVKNRDLWEGVLKELDRLDRVLIQWVHVRGHQDNLDDEIVMGNNVADYLASYKNNTEFELDLPLKEEKKLPLYYFYDPDSDEVYYAMARRHGGDLTVGAVKNEGAEEAMELWREREMYIDFSTDPRYIGDGPSTIRKSYYLHEPSRVYFTDEAGKDMGKDVKEVGPCRFSSEVELIELLQKVSPPLYRSHGSYRIRGEITPCDDLPF